EGANAAAVRWQFVNDGRIKIAIKRQPERAWNRCRGHDEQVWVPALAHELLALRHTELVLLVDDHEAEFRHVESRRNEGVSADVERRKPRVTRRTSEICRAFGCSTFDGLG